MKKSPKALEKANDNKPEQDTSRQRYRMQSVTAACYRSMKAGAFASNE
jgi:hypothetical protein